MEIQKEINLSNKLVVQQENTSSGLQLCKIDVNEEYSKKWNIHLNDFLCLTKDGKLISNNLYRIGGLGKPNLQKDNYFMLLKYVEAYYDKKIIDITKSDPKHLEGRWTIIDKNGVEKYEHKRGIDHPYLVKNSCIYSLNKSYYNIETGELYCESYTRMETENFLFLDNAYDDDKSKRGVMKINKKDGTFEMFN